MVCGVCRCFIVLEGMCKLMSPKKLGIICLGVSSMTDGNSFLFWWKGKFDGFFVQMSSGVKFCVYHLIVALMAIFLRCL